MRARDIFGGRPLAPGGFSVVRGRLDGPSGAIRVFMRKRDVHVWEVFLASYVGWWHTQTDEFCFLETQCRIYISGEVETKNDISLVLRFKSLIIISSSKRHGIIKIIMYFSCTHTMLCIYLSKSIFPIFFSSFLLVIFKSRDLIPLF